MTAMRIKKLRTRLHLPQTLFAQLLGVHWVTVSSWERGELEPNPWRCELLEVLDAARPPLTDNIRNVLEKLASPRRVSVALSLLLADGLKRGGGS